jgi:hypothetical protein
MKHGPLESITVSMGPKGRGGMTNWKFMGRYRKNGHGNQSSLKRSNLKKNKEIPYFVQRDRLISMF